MNHKPTVENAKLLLNGLRNLPNTIIGKDDMIAIMENIVIDMELAKQDRCHLCGYKVLESGACSRRGCANSD